MQFANETKSMRQYFDGLPSYIQEALWQTDIQIQSLEHLKSLVGHILSPDEAFPKS